MALEAAHVEGTEGQLATDERYGIRIYREMRNDGRRVTLMTPDCAYLCGDELSSVASAGAEEILGIMTEAGRRMERREPLILAVGLGNRHIASDSQGTHFAESLDATHHLKEGAPELYRLMGGKSLCVITPGTEGQSGIDPQVRIRSLVKELDPDIVVVVDALATGSDEYIGRTLQISDRGIVPGSGIGNSKKEISSETVGAYVIALGVPTVISSSTLIVNSFEKAGIADIPAELEDVLENGRSFFVAPKNADLLSEGAGRLCAEVVRRVLADI